MRTSRFILWLNWIILKLTLLAGRMAAYVNRNRRWIQAIAGAIALGLGFWGFWQTVEPDQRSWSTLLDTVFQTAQLVTLQFPSDIKNDMSWPLQIARFAVPLVAVLASFQVLIGSITRPARLALLPLASGHIVVCGSEAMTEAALIALAKRGRQVISVSPSIDSTQRDTLEGLGITIVEGDPLLPATINSLNLSRAAALFLTAEDDITNLNIAMLALGAIDARPPELPMLVLAVMIDREDLAAELDLALDSLSRSHRVRYHRLCADREGIRLELARYAPVLLKASSDIVSHVLVVGLAGTWRQVIMQIIVAAQDHPDKRPVLTFVVDDSGAALVQHWREVKPELDLVAEVVVLTTEADELLPSEDDAAQWREKYPAPQLAVVLREDADAIATTLALRRPGNPLRTEETPILVRQSKEDRLLSRLGETVIPDRYLSKLVAVGGLVRADTIERVLDYKGDEMAIALHAQYRESMKSAEKTSALEEWDGLPENIRDANRAAANHIPILFGAAGFRISSSTPAAQPPALSAEDVERLARVEHRRWVADRIDRRWRYGESRDDRLLLHPDLVPYEKLSDSKKEQNRNWIRTLAGIVAARGSTIEKVQAG